MVTKLRSSRLAQNLDARGASEGAAQMSRRLAVITPASSLDLTHQETAREGRVRTLTAVAQMMDASALKVGAAIPSPFFPFIKPLERI